MRTSPVDVSICRCCTSRRRFLQRCAGCSFAAVMATQLRLPATEPESSPSPSVSSDRVRVRLIFACWAVVQDRPTWPHIGHDMRPEIERVTNALRDGCPEIEFLPVMAHSIEDAEKILAQHEADKIDGYLVYNMNNWIQVFHRIAASGHPMLLADFIYAGSGGFLVHGSQLRRKHSNFSLVASSNTDDLIAAAKCFTLLKSGTVEQFVAACDRIRKERTPQPRIEKFAEDPLQCKTIGQCLEEVKASGIISLGGGNKGVAAAIQQRFGIPVHFVNFEEMAEIAESVDQAKVDELVEKWQKGAQKVVIDQPEETLKLSAANYLAQKALLDKYRAEAITINCLGGFYSGKLKAYPCLGFVELLNMGLVGACEADLPSTLTMVIVNHLAGRPGYISDPVIDTSKREIIYAHCVATTKPFGPQGPENAYEILTHSEDRRGASVRSYLPVGYLTSTVEIYPDRQEILFHQAVAAENVVIDRACRTKLGCEVSGDIDKLLLGWSNGWHRVTFYGDLREPIKELAQSLQFKLIEEA
ncbi:MAG: hypothetical protein ACUVQG_06360 [Thermogutta sp.]